uniref:Family with sequence similarity 131 member C n=1 Tax=Sus scrofa TaxID=9823 RepID=A0A8D0LYY7_PIG
MPQGTAPLSPNLPSSCPPIMAPDRVTGKDKQMDFCWDPWQRCFQTTNGYLSDSRSCSSNYNVAALATSSLVGVVQSIKDHITKPTAMARGRVAHLIEWKGWSAQRSGWELSPAEDEHYCCLPDELREARFAAGVAEQFAITEATLSAWSSLDDEELNPENSPQDVVQLQGTVWGGAGMGGLLQQSRGCLQQSEGALPACSDTRCPRAQAGPSFSRPQFLYLKKGTGDSCPTQGQRTARSIKERIIMREREKVT